VNGLVRHEKIVGRIIKALSCFQYCVKHVSYEFLRITFPWVENVGQSGESSITVFAAEPLYPEHPVARQGLVEPLGLHRVKTPAYQAKTAGSMAKGTLTGRRKMDSFTFYEIPLDFSRKSD